MYSYIQYIYGVYLNILVYEKDIINMYSYQLYDCTSVL